jgi:predicted dehydrogenase
MSLPDTQYVAVCDVDTGHREKAKAMLEDYYKQKGDVPDFKGIDAYNDFREVLARQDIDAVMIATPDFWHAVMSVAAAQAGKDIYCEKPLANSIPEGRAVVNAVRRYKRVLQTGSHERSRDNARYAAELIRNGRIGKLHTIRVNQPIDNHSPIPPAAGDAGAAPGSTTTCGSAPRSPRPTPRSAATSGSATSMTTPAAK